MAKRSTGPNRSISVFLNARESLDLETLKALIKHF